MDTNEYTEIGGSYVENMTRRTFILPEDVYPNMVKVFTGKPKNEEDGAESDGN